MAVNKDWICSCGAVNTGNFCSNCGKAKPQPKESKDWTCSCGTVNTGNFCSHCGKKKGEQEANPFRNAKVGDFVKLGSYPQTSSGQNKSIEWQVLSIENNKMLVISRYGLETKRFDSGSNNWENSEIRKWLNGEFYNKAFNDNEKKSINLSNLSDVGTSDNIFLLSKEEAEKYFANYDDRKCKATDYAVKNDAYVWNVNGCSAWWLRSPYPNRGDSIFYVNCGGGITCGGGISLVNIVNDDNSLARPALWINLKDDIDNQIDLTSKVKVQNRQLKVQISSQVPSNSFKNVKVGDYIKFGNYPQTSHGQIQPIEWQVLSIENNRMLVISRYGLEAKRFDIGSNNWENSEIRKWLNGEFYNKSFNENEKKFIRNSSISTIVYKGGFLGIGRKEELSYTNDRVFLLSKEEAKKYFVNDDVIKCKATNYAKKNGAYVDSDDGGYSHWWLRSPFPYSGGGDVYIVFSGGNIFSCYVDCLVPNLARPALWINL